MYDHVVYKYLDEVGELVMNYYQGSLLRYLGIEEVKLSAKRRAEAFIANDFFNAYCMKDYVQNVCFNPEDSENPVLQFASFLYQCVGTLYEEITSMVSSRWASMKFKTINDLNNILWLLKCQFTFYKKKADGEKIDDNPKDWDYLPKKVMYGVFEHPELYFKDDSFWAYCGKIKMPTDFSTDLYRIIHHFDEHEDIYMSKRAYEAFLDYLVNTPGECKREMTIITKDNEWHLNTEEHWITFWKDDMEVELKMLFLRMDNGNLYRVVADSYKIKSLNSNHKFSTPRVGYYVDEHFADEVLLEECSEVKPRRFNDICFYE